MTPVPPECPRCGDTRSIHGTSPLGIPTVTNCPECNLVAPTRTFLGSAGESVRRFYGPNLEAVREARRRGEA